jgi:integrase
MGRPTNRLSALTIKKKLPPGLYADGGGLYLQVSQQKTKAWIFRFTRAGVPRKMGLGPVSVKTDDKRITLADARQKAAAARSLLIDGIDPIAARDARRAQTALAEAQAVTFKHCADEYIKDNKAGWKNEVHRRQWESTLDTYVHPTIGHLPVAGVNTALVLKILRPIWTTKSETANRVRGRIESVLDWAKTHTYRDGENPARWRGHLDNVLPARSKVRKVQHHKAIPYPEIPGFMASLRAMDSTSARALEFTILTAARTGEAIGSRWSELSDDDGIWTVPGERMKGGRDHRVPISDRARAVVATQKRGVGFIFPGSSKGKPLSNMAMLELLRGLRKDGSTVHGFRSAFRDWASEKTDHANEVVEMALAHVIESKVEAAYRRGDLFDKRRALMIDWADYCSGAAQ